MTVGLLLLCAGRHRLPWHPSFTLPCLHCPHNRLAQVPELEGDFSVRAPNFKPLLEKLDRAQAVLGKERAIPMLIGPVTYVCLSKRDLPLADAVDR